MAGDTITRAQLSEAVYEEVGLSRNESADLVEAVLEEMVSSLTEGETVKISSFGSFSIRQNLSVWVEIQKPVKRCQFFQEKL